MPLVVVERDGPFGDVEGEVAIGAVAVLPAVMGFLEKIVGEPLDCVADGHHRPFGLGVAPDGGGDLDIAGRQGNDFVAGLGFDVLDLAAVAIAVETDGDDGEAGGGERIEDDGLVRGTQFGVEAIMLAALDVPIR